MKKKNQMENIETNWESLTYERFLESRSHNEIAPLGFLRTF